MLPCSVTANALTTLNGGDSRKDSSASFVPQDSGGFHPALGQLQVRATAGAPDTEYGMGKRAKTAESDEQREGKNKDNEGERQ